MGVVGEVTILPKIQFILSPHICTCKPHKSLPDLSTWIWKCQWHKHTNSVRNQIFQLSLLHKEGDWSPHQQCHSLEWGHSFAWVLSSYGKSPVETLSMAQCLGHLAVVTPSKRKSRTCQEQCWAQTLHRLFPHLLQTWLRLFFPWAENSEQGGGPAVVWVLFSCFISRRGWSAGLEMQGLSSTRFITSPGSTNACSRNQASTTPTQVGPSREKPKEFTEMIVKDPIILQLG